MFLLDFEIYYLFLQKNKYLKEKTIKSRCWRGRVTQNNEHNHRPEWAKRLQTGVKPPGKCGIPH